MKTLRAEAAIHAEWFDLLVAAARYYPSEVFANEFREWFVQQGELFDGSHLDEIDIQQRDNFIHTVGQMISVANRAKLLSTTNEIPYRLYPNSRLHLFPETAYRVTKKGDWLHRQSKRIQEAYFAYRIALSIGSEKVAKLRVPIAVLSFCFAVAKIIFQWNTLSASIAAALAAAAAAVSVAISSNQ